jgi:hypothetical protein
MCERLDGKANAAGLTRPPGKVFLTGHSGERESGVKVETNDERVALEHQGDFQRIAGPWNGSALVDR